MNRLFEITYILLNQETITAKELAEHFGVSQRTIYRDIDALDLAGIPVYTEKGKGGGISLLPEFVLNKAILNEREQQEILSALQSFSSVKTEETDKVIQKLSAFFKKSMVNWLEVDFSDWNNPDSDNFAKFKTAIFEHRIAEFDYYSSMGEKTHRRIEPLQLWFKSKAWYVKGFCLKRKEKRLFKLTRIKQLKITKDIFPERKIFPASNESESEKYKKRLISLVLKIAPEMTYRVYDEFDDNSIEKQPDGSFIVSIECPEDDWAIGFILSFAEYIEVLEPERIRKIIKEKLLKINENYL
jgi:predicted DNA-binding transcriptional regulator YafY